MFDKIQKQIDHWFAKSDSTVNAITMPTYIISLVLIHVLYFLAFFGIVYINPEYTRQLTMFMETIICVFLMIRFNPFREPKISSFDLKIIFSAAILLLTNIGIVDVLLVYIKKIKSLIE